MHLTHNPNQTQIISPWNPLPPKGTQSSAQQHFYQQHQIALFPATPTPRFNRHFRRHLPHSICKQRDFSSISVRTRRSLLQIPRTSSQWRQGEIHFPLVCTNCESTPSLWGKKGFLMLFCRLPWTSTIVSFGLGTKLVSHIFLFFYFCVLWSSLICSMFSIKIK